MSSFSGMNSKSLQAYAFWSLSENDFEKKASILNEGEGVGEGITIYNGRNTVK